MRAWIHAGFHIGFFEKGGGGGGIIRCPSPTRKQCFVQSVFEQLHTFFAATVVTLLLFIHLTIIVLTQKGGGNFLSLPPCMNHCHVLCNWCMQLEQYNCWIVESAASVADGFAGTSAWCYSGVESPPHEQKSIYGCPWPYRLVLFTVDSQTKY